MLHIPILLALILAIVGGSRISSADSSKHSSGESFEKAGSIIFLISYLAIFAFAILTMADFSKIPLGEKRILYSPFAFSTAFSQILRITARSVFSMGTQRSNCVWL